MGKKTNVKKLQMELLKLEAKVAKLRKKREGALKLAADLKKEIEALLGGGAPTKGRGKKRGRPRKKKVGRPAKKKKAGRPKKKKVGRPTKKKKAGRPKKKKAGRPKK
jgi:hypothetical protein